MFSITKPPTGPIAAFVNRNIKRAQTERTWTVFNIMSEENATTTFHRTPVNLST